MIYRPKNFELNKIIGFISETEVVVIGDDVIREDNASANLYGSKKRQIPIWIYTAGTKQELVHGPRIKIEIPGQEASYAIDIRSGDININNSDFSAIKKDETEIRKTVQAIAYYDLDFIVKCHTGNVDPAIKKRAIKDMLREFNKLDKATIKFILNNGHKWRDHLNK